MYLRGYVVLSLLVLSGPSGRTAEVARVELYALQTTTMTDEQFLKGEKGTPTVVAAELRLPQSSAERLPAMIVVHGSGGIDASEDGWVRQLNELGIATLLIDGFTTRGVVDLANNPAQLGYLTMVNDAYRALEMLAKHPRIDPSRIGILGGSRGGFVALYASVKRFQRLHGAAGQQFAVFLPFYALCNRTHIDDTDVVDRPIRLFHGAADDWTLVTSCRTYVERLRRAGKDVTLTEYVGAYHNFDHPLLTPLRRTSPRVRNIGSCPISEDPVGRFINRENGRPFTLEDPCVQSGATVGYDARAHAQAIEGVKVILRQVLQPEPR